MSMPYVGEIKLFAFGRTPQDWIPCDGSLQSIAIYWVLYGLVGTTYGGDGVSTFGVPDLRGRIPLCMGQGPLLTQRTIGDQGGVESVALTPAQMPSHRHRAYATTRAATGATPGPTVLPAAVNGDTFYATDITGATAVPFASQAIVSEGDGQAHPNTMPTLALHYCIAANGIYPPRS